MAAKVLCKFKNLFDVANNYKDQQTFYFFLKNYAFNKTFNFLSKDYSGISFNDKQTVEYLLGEFQKEKNSINPTDTISKQDYEAFLEFFYEGFDLDNSPPYILEVCRDLTEVLSVYGDFEYLWLQRMDYFNKKLAILGIETTIQGPDILINYAVNMSETKKTNNEVNKINSNNNTNLNTNTNNAKSFTSSNEYNILSKPSKSVEDLNLPTVKDEEYDIHKKIKFDSNYVPKLVDRSIKLPITKNSSNYSKVKELVKMHMEYAGLEIDFHKLELSKDHIEAAIYYLRNIQ